MKIDFLVAENEYGSTHYFAKKFCKALERTGAQTRLFWIGEGLFYKAFYAICNDPPDLTCSFSDITFGNKEPLGSQWHIPHLSLLIDPAVYFLHQLRGDYSLVSSVDLEDCEFIKKLGFSRAFFLPHGVDRSLRSNETERPYDIVMIGTCIDPEEVRLKWKTQFSPQQCQILEKGAQRVLSNEGVSTLQVLLEAGIQENLPILHHELDLYIGGKDRIDLVNALQGLSVHVWGRGPWEKCCPKAFIHPSISYTQSLSIMKKAKIVLNSSPRFKHGSHERIFHASACGAAVATSESSYILRDFEKNKSLLTYSHEGWKEFRSRILSLLNDPCRLFEMAEQGRKITLAHHTWDHRAQELLKQLRVCKHTPKG